MPRISSRLALLVACLAAFPSGSAGQEAAGSWSRLRFSAQLRLPRAVAYEPVSRRLAVGEMAGVWLRQGAGDAARVLSRGAVRDLAFDTGGVLWAATETGLFRIPATGVAERARLSAGRADRDVRRVVARSSAVACATGSGAFWSFRGGPFQRVRGLPRGAVDAVALSDSGELIAVLDGRAFRVARNSLPERVVPGQAPRRIVDAAFRRASDAAPERLLLLAADALFVERRPIASPSPGIPGSPVWERIDVTAPPGSTLERIHPVGTRDYISTDRDLLVRAHDAAVDAPWRRALEPSQRQYVARVVGASGVRFAVGDAGVLQWQPSLPAGAVVARAGGGPSALDLDPPIEELRRAVLRYLDLGPGRMRKLWRGARRRGWLPTLELRGAYGGRRDQGHDVDETFTSGERRSFYDRDWGRARDFDVAALLRFELGDIAYQPESIDVSREAREVIELRDDVLDEVNQLYFERRRVLREAAGAADPEEAARLRDRAAELAAGLDAWSGGWFERRRRLSSPQGSGMEKHP